MDLMLNVSTQGTWEPWIRFCLEGVIEQAIDTERRCDKLLQLQQDFHARVAKIRGGSVRLSNFVDHLFYSPVVLVNSYRRRFGVTYPTARADLKKLEAAGIVQPMEWEGPLAYSCGQIYNVTFEDTPSPK